MGRRGAFRDTAYPRYTNAIAFAPDGHFATATNRGVIRLYDSAFKLVVPPRRTRAGTSTGGLAFSPDGKVLAVGYGDTATVVLLDGRSLKLLPPPQNNRLGEGSLDAVGWSRDGQTLYAGGDYDDGHGSPLVSWSDRGTGEQHAIAVPGGDPIAAIVPLPNDKVLLTTTGPSITMLGPGGRVEWHHGARTADFSTQEDTLGVSPDANTVDFAYEADGKSRLRFNLRKLSLTADPGDDHITAPPVRQGLPLENWDNSEAPMLDGKRIALARFETSQSMAVAPDASRFILGTSWYLRAFDRTGKLLWTRSSPGTAWAVNIAANGRLAVVAYEDGTIRWHRMDDGRELLAFMVLPDRTNWVTWTPEGFYAATPGAHGVLSWHVNRGGAAAAAAIPVSQIPKLSRPDAIPFVIQEMETARALGVADLAAARRDVQIATGAARPPGARLHVLAVGVSDYGSRAASLHLDFAGKDAHDVVNSILNTQGSLFNQAGGLYAEVLPIYLHDDTADRAGIFEALASMQNNMSRNASGQDVAVVMFSGHGAILDGRFYLLPYGVDARTPAALKASAIPASEFQAEVAKLAEHGRVLVLLDACRAGAITADGSALGTDADLLRRVMAGPNVTVLTSSKADKVSREDPKWQNGAFTKIVLEAFGRAADTNNDGLISVSEMADYITRNLPTLTAGAQEPGMEQRFQSDIFVAGL